MSIRGVARVLSSALLLGIVGNGLVRADRLGLNFFLGIVALVVVTATLARSERRSPPRRVLLLWLLPPIFAFGLAWRDAPLLSVWNVLAVAATLTLPVIGLGGVRLSRGRPLDYARGLVTTGLRTARGPLGVVSRELPWREVSTRLRRRRSAAVAVGLGLAAPLLVLFGVLLAAADAGFERVMSAVFSLDIEALISHAVGTGFIGWISAGYLGAVLVLAPEPAPSRPSGNRLALGAVELGIPLGGLALLFSVFVTMQAEYVFGGHALIRGAVDLGYAEYARRGFFELVALAVLVLPVLLAAEAAADPTDAATRRIVRGLSGGLLLLVGLIMVSALHRLRLYLDVYGLTQDRLYATGVLLWAGLAIAWFAATVLRGRADRFAGGAIVGALAVLGMLNVINLDAVVVRTNVARAQAGAELDAGYLTSLSADAVPALVSVLPGLPDEAACVVLEAWSPAAEPGARRDWRSWNVARARARDMAADLHAARVTRCGAGE